MKSIQSYIISLTNLYGIVDKDKVLEIYNAQNKDAISKIIIDDFNNVYVAGREDIASAWEDFVLRLNPYGTSLDYKNTYGYFNYELCSFLLFAVATVQGAGVVYFLDLFYTA